MIKRVKTKSSTPGRSSVKSERVDRASVLSIFGGSDQDSTENSKAFDNPQEERGQDTSENANVPEMPMAEPGDPGRTGANFSSPNFSLNTGKITEKPKSQMNSDYGPSLPDKTSKPLQKTATNEGSVPSLINPGMPKPVLDRYQPANEVAKQNASFPKDFRSEMSPIREGFTTESLDQREPIKNSLYSQANQIKFESFDNAKRNLKEKSDSEIQNLTNPEIQADYFTSSAKEAIPGNFFATSEMAPSNVFSEYNNTTAEYGKGQMPQTKESSSLMTEKSGEAARISSPQRASDSLGNTEGKSSFKGDSISKPELSVDTGIKDKVTGSLSNKESMQSGKDNSSSLGQWGKSYFVSNFSSVPPGISGAVENSSTNTSNAESQVSSNTNI
jgi:hypothetical protein